MSIFNKITKIWKQQKSAEILYKKLQTNIYKKLPYETTNLGEEMSVINEVILDFWKPRFLVNHNTKCAYEFMNHNQYLVTVTKDDIDWDSLKDLPEDAQETAKHLSFLFPSFIRSFVNGVAEVSWQLNPDGRYYMDEDGFGMTNDEKVEIYGFIDTKGKVIVNFRAIADESEHELMRKEAEEKAKCLKKSEQKGEFLAKHRSPSVL